MVPLCLIAMEGRGVFAKAHWVVAAWLEEILGGCCSRCGAFYWGVVSATVKGIDRLVLYRRQNSEPRRQF